MSFVKRVCLLILLSAGAQSPCIAQNMPYGVFTTTTSGTISVTNTFQSIISRSDFRRSCSVQNNGTHTMYVYFGTLANATLTNSFQISAGQMIYCTVSQLVLQDQVSITGTATDAYVVTVQ